MHPLAQGIANFQEAHNLFRESLDHRDLEPKTEIPDQRSQRLSFAEQILRPRRERVETFQQWGRRSFQCKRLDGRTGRLKRIERQIDTIEALVVLAAILQV